VRLLTPIHSYILILSFKGSESLTCHRDVWWGKPELDIYPVFCESQPYLLLAVTSARFQGMVPCMEQIESVKLYSDG
jgi:hypothetical protein